MDARQQCSVVEKPRVDAAASVVRKPPTAARLPWCWRRSLRLRWAWPCSGPWSRSTGTSTVGMGFEPPSADHPLGTDKLGRDVLARTLARRRASSGCGPCGHAGRHCHGHASGVCHCRPVVGRAGLSAVVDLFVVIPSVVTLMVLVFGLGAGVGTMVVVTVVASAPYMARYMRSVVRPVLASDYVAAARLAGDLYGSWPCARFCPMWRSRWPPARPTVHRRGLPGGKRCVLALTPWAAGPTGPP